MLLEAAAGAALIGCAAIPLTMLRALRALEASVGIAPPTAAMLQEEPHEKCPLFRHVPQLQQAIAWRSLGAARTPIHVCKLDRHTIYVKREDLTSPLYGGNKVRTLQHQLAVLEARLASAETDAERRRVHNTLVIGTGGSNQVVATVVHARQLRLPPISVAWLQDDLPDLDNTLNMLSTLSLPIGSSANWGKRTGILSKLFAVLRGHSVALPMGGNNPAGVFGQVSGALELAEQIADGEMPDPNRLYLAVGSSCTISGLVIGVAVAHRLGLQAFLQPDFQIVGVPIHHAFAAAQRRFGVHTAGWARAVPLTVGRTVDLATRALRELGGPDVSKEALYVMANHLRFEADAALVGTYGGHSEQSLAAAEAYDARATITDATGASAPPLWLCGHFAAKAFGALLADLKQSDKTDASPPVVLMWQTKSAVQPRGEVDEWKRMAEMPNAVRAWADAGKATSELRPGSVCTSSGSPWDYRPLMTSIPSP